MDIRKNYATKNNVNDVNNQLKSFSSLQQFEMMQSKINDVKHIMKNEYCTKEAIDGFINKSEQKLCDKLVSFEKYSLFIHETDKEFGVLMNEQARVRTVEADQKDRVKRLFKISKELNNNLAKKSSIEELTKIDEKFKDYCSYSHLKTLRNEVIPVIQDFTSNIKIMQTDMIQHKSIIARFDEILLTKASKISLETISKNLKNYVLTLDFYKFQSKHNIFENKTSENFTELEDNLNSINKKLDEEIKIAVKKATNYLSNELK
mmetsp:Transcript_27057/g.23902  ORF Transcript_27057/g.23902 Transcript_27057/m.23902 type:complete len:262 (+) Transcript_27057:558-1343(+)